MIQLACKLSVQAMKSLVLKDGAYLIMGASLEESLHKLSSLFPRRFREGNIPVLLLSVNTMQDDWGMSSASLLTRMYTSTGRLPHGGDTSTGLLILFIRRWYVGKQRSRLGSIVEQRLN